MPTNQTANNHLKHIKTHVSGVLGALGEPPSEVSVHDDPETRSRKIATREKQLRDREEFIKIYQPAIMAYIRGVLSKFLNDSSNMPEHVSAVWANLVDKFLQGKLKSFKHSGEEGSFRAWLRTVISNDCKQYLRKHKNANGNGGVTSLDGLDLEDPVAEDRTLELVLRETVIERAYQTMEDDGLYGTAVLFAADRAGEFTTAELAEHLSRQCGKTITHDAAKKRLARGRMLFAQAVIEQVAKLDDSSDLSVIEETLIDLRLHRNCKKALQAMRE